MEAFKAPGMTPDQRREFTRLWKEAQAVSMSHDEFKELLWRSIVEMWERDRAALDN